MLTFRRTIVFFCFMSLLAYTAVAHADYRLGATDHLRIKIQEWPDLTGEYVVTSDGTISIPLIGEIKAEGFQIRELSEQISDLLQRRAGGERPYAVVDIIQYRPFVIIGDVQRPGDYPYRPGLTVLEAIGIAGGYYRPAEPGIQRLERDIAIATGEIKALSSRLTILLARSARLAAAIAGGDINFPPELLKQKDNAVVAAIFDSERTALTLERATAKNQSDDLESLRQLYLQEIASLHGQQDGLKQEQGILQHQLADLRSLSGKGLALAPSMFSLERSLAQSGNEQLSLEIAIVRAQENIKVAEEKARDQTLERNRSNTKELQQVKDEIVDTRSRLITQRNLLDEAQMIAPAQIRSHAAEDRPRNNIVILRTNGRERREILVDESFLVEPNDVIRVPLQARNLGTSFAPEALSKEAQVAE